MADNDNVSIKFGANIAEFQAKAAQLKAGLEDVGTKARAVGAAAQQGAAQATSAFQSMEVGIESIRSKVATLGALVGVAFSIDAIKNWTVAAIDAADKVSASAAKTGLSTGQVQLLGGVEALAGASDLIGGLSTLESNLRAISDGTDATSASLKVLGLTAGQLKGQLPTTQLEIIAGAVAKFGDGATKTAAVTNLLGSATEGMIRTLDEGAAGVRRLEDATVSAGGVIESGLIQSLSRTHQDILELNQAWTSGAGVIVGVVNPAIDAVVVKLTEMLDGITPEKITPWIVAIGTAVIDILAKIAEFAVGVKARFDEMLASIPTFDKTGFFSAVFETLNQLTNQVDGKTKFVQERLKSLDEAGGAAMAGLSDAARKTAGSITEIERAADKAKSALKDMLNAGRPALYGEYGQRGAEQPGHALPQVPAIPAAADKDTTQKIDRDATARYEQDLKAFMANATAKENSLNEQLAMHQITTSQWLAQTTDALEDEKQDVQATYAAELADERITDDQKADLRTKLQEQLEEIAKKEQQAQIKAAEESKRAWTEMFSGINSAFESQIDSLLRGAETFRTAMRKTLADLIEQFAKFSIGKLLTGGESLLGNALGIGSVGTAAATTANTTALAVLTTATTALTAAMTGATAAPGASAATAGGSGLFAGLAGLTHLFGFAEGTPYVQSTGLAVIHQGEMITPADLNPNNPASSVSRGGSGGAAGGFGGNDGGGVTHNHNWGGVHVNTGGRELDPADVAKAMDKAVRSGAHTGLKAFAR